MIREIAIRRLTARYGGRARDLAYLELTQEHLLHWMVVNGVFDEDVRFKGGTALRKFVFGLEGRFSTDLDFSTNNTAVGEFVLEALRAEVSHEGVLIRVVRDDAEDDGRHIYWQAETGEFGKTLVAKLDFTTYPMLLPPEHRSRRDLPGVDSTMGFEPVIIPLVDLRENVSEKLARLRRLVVARDLFDLAKLGPAMRDELPLLLEMLCFKVYFDVVETSRGLAPFRGGAEFDGLSRRELGDQEDLGQLIGKPPDLRELAASVERVYTPMGEPKTARERRLAACRHDFRQWAFAEVETFRS